MAARAGETAGGLLRPANKHAWLPVVCVLIIYAVHLIYGGIVSDVALIMDLAAALLLGGVLLNSEIRADLLRLKGLELAGLLFALVLAVGVWSLTPYVPGGPHPVWSYVGLKGGATIDRSSTIVELVKLAGLACFFLLGAACGARDERARFSLQLVVLAGAAFGLWALIVGATGTVFQTQGHRLEAHFLNPNTAGNVFAALFVLSVAALVREIRSQSKWSAAKYLLSLSTLTLGVALLATASRGAVTAALLGLTVFLTLQLATGGLRLTRALAGTLVGILLVTGLVFLAGDLVVERFFRAEEDAAVRAAIWEAHWPVFLDAPMMGYGLGTFEAVNRSVLTLANFDSLWNLRAPLNVYLQWLEEGGLLAAAPMFLCIGWLIWITVRGTFRRSRMTGLLAGLIALDLTFLVHGITDSALQAASIAAFWAWALGLQVALAQGSSRR